MNPPDSSRKIAPGPPGHPIVGVLNEFREDRLGFLLSMRQEYRDAVAARVGRGVESAASPDAFGRPPARPDRQPRAGGTGSEGLRRRPALPVRLAELGDGSG